MTKSAKEIGHIEKSVSPRDKTSQAQILSIGAKRQPVVAAPAGQEYVDPFLFESGHFKSRKEYEELTRTAKIKPRART